MYSAFFASSSSFFFPYEQTDDLLFMELLQLGFVISNFVLDRRFGCSSYGPGACLLWEPTESGKAVGHSCRLFVDGQGHWLLPRWLPVTAAEWTNAKFLFSLIAQSKIQFWAGMSDLCSPISILLENEADAFWCFERLMRRLVCIHPPFCALFPLKLRHATFSYL